MKLGVSLSLYIFPINISILYLSPSIYLFTYLVRVCYPKVSHNFLCYFPLPGSYGIVLSSETGQRDGTERRGNAPQAYTLPPRPPVPSSECSKNFVHM